MNFKASLASISKRSALSIGIGAGVLGAAGSYGYQRFMHPRGNRRVQEFRAANVAALGFTAGFGLSSIRSRFK